MIYMIDIKMNRNNVKFLILEDEIFTRILLRDFKWWVK